MNGGLLVRTLLVALALATLAPTGAADAEPTPYVDIDRVKGKLVCGASAAGVSTEDRCRPPNEPAANVLKLELRPGATAVVVEPEWSPSGALGAKQLRFVFDPPIDAAETEAWEGVSPGRLVLADVAGGPTPSWRLVALPPVEDAGPSVMFEQPFAVVVSTFYHGLAPPPGYSALEGDPPGLPTSPAPAETTDPGGAGLHGSRAPAFVPREAAPDPARLLLALASLATAGGAALALPRVRRLAWLGLLPLFSRLDEDRVVGHPRRAMLMALVRAQPGVASEAARRRLALANGAFEHHVRVLVSHGQLRRREIAGHVHLFPPDAPVAARDALTLPARLLELVSAEPGHRQVDLARRLGAREGTVRYHATWLARRGALRLVPDGRAVRCYPA